MNLDDEDEVIGMQLNSQGDQLLFVSELGMGKCTSTEEFTCQNRGGKGVKCYRINEKTGNLVGVKAVLKHQEIMIITTEGIIIRIKVADISTLGRNTSGVKLINIDAESDVRVASIAKVRESENSDEEEADETAEDSEDSENVGQEDADMERLLHAAQIDESEDEE